MSKKEELKKDLDRLTHDVETYIVNEEKLQFLQPLRYRLQILEEKFEDIKYSLGSTTRGEREQNLTFVRAILN